MEIFFVIYLFFFIIFFSIDLFISILQFYCWHFGILINE